MLEYLFSQSGQESAPTWPPSRMACLQVPFRTEPRLKRGFIISSSGALQHWAATDRHSSSSFQYPNVRNVQTRYVAC